MATLGQLVAKNQKPPSPSQPRQPVWQFLNDFEPLRPETGKQKKPSFTPQNDLERIAYDVSLELSSHDFEGDQATRVAKLATALDMALDRNKFTLKKHDTQEAETAASQPEPAPQPSPLRTETTPLCTIVKETLASSEHLDRNDDRFVILQEHNLAAIFDGVGGGEEAVRASMHAAELLPTKITQKPNIETLLHDLHSDLQASRTDSGTTGAIAIITNDNGTKTLSFAQVGDSRISVWHKADGSYELAALDDRLIRYLLLPPSKRPPVMAELLTKYNLDPELNLDTMAVAKLATVLDQHPNPASVSAIAKLLFEHRAQLTQNLGSGDIRVHTGSLEVMPGDRVLLATDGLHDNLTEQEIVSLLGGTKIEETASLLVVRAHEVALSDAPRAKKDDITAIVLEIV